MKVHKFQSGELAYILECNSYVTKVKVLGKTPDGYTVKYPHGGNICVHASRLYSSESEAQARIAR